MKGCLLIHGFTGSPEELRPLADYLQKNTNWLIQTPTLPGHGAGETLKSVTWEDWIAAAEIELKSMEEQCDEIYVIGFSMGGMIAAYLASKYPISKLVLLSAAVYCLNPQLILKDLKGLVKDHIMSSSSLLPKNMERYKQKVSNTPLKAVLNFRKLVKTVTPKIRDIKVPILIIQGEQDLLVQPRSADYIYEQVQSEEKELVFLKESKHTVCHDCEKEILFTKVDQFLKHQELFLQ